MSAQDHLFAAEYKRSAIYYDMSDAVEYLRSDDTCIYRRIDAHLTLALDMDTREVIGFRIKGFKNLYLRELKPFCDKLGIEFLDLAQAFQNIVGAAGDKMVDEAREAYATAYAIAANDNVVLRELPVSIAA